MATAVRDPFSSNDSSENKPATTGKARAITYHPGQPVPAPGTYWVCHQSHRPTHAAKVRFTVFPSCAQCGTKVKYLPAEAQKGLITQWLRRDPDFKQALKPVRRRRRRTTAKAAPAAGPV